MILKKIMAGAMVAVIAGAGVLAWQYRAELQTSAGLRKDKQQMADVISNNRATIESLQIEKHRLEIALRDRAEKQAKIETEYQSTTKKLKAEIEQMRAANEEIDEFLRLPVPDDLAEWMRQRAAGGNADRNGAGDAADDTAGTD